MATVRFDRTRIEGFLALIGERLAGEWLLIGGGAAAAWFSPGRTTEDLDVIGLGGSQAERFALMDLATEASLPIEAVNSAADFFVRRIPDWRDHLVELHRGSRGIVYRPDPTLFLLLKVNRLSEIDLSDCVALIEHCRRIGEVIDLERVKARLAELPATDDVSLLDRRAKLRDALA